MRALVVEDDDRIAGDLARALTAAGFRVEHADDGEVAWFRGGTERYDLIVLDLGLPRMDGLSVLKRWRREGCDSPVLVLTARGAGVPDASLDGLLRRGARLDMSGDGQGIGHAIVADIAEAAGGRLDLRNAHPGLCTELRLRPFIG